MPYEPTTNFKDSNNVDLGKKLVTKDYLLEVYGSILDSIGNSGLTVTPAVWNWGLNSNGQLGINDTINRSTPITTILGGVNWEFIDDGQSNRAALKTDGTLWLWGSGFSGHLGINATTNRSTPVTTILGGNNWKSIACGTDYTTAIKTDGTLWTWGSNSFGQLGINATTNRSTPITTILGGTNWKSVDCGAGYTVAIKTDGTLWTWGYGFEGQLGNLGNTDRSTPVTTVLGGTNWKQITCGYRAVAAIKTDGTLWGWGLNDGQLGIDDITRRSTPVTTILGGNNWKFVAGGGEGLGTVIAAIKTDGTLWLSGGRTTNLGQLGINDTIARSTPITTILGGTNWKTVDCGRTFITAIKTDGTLWTWGRNNAGQLGINDTIARSTPVTTILGGTNWKLSSGGDQGAAAIQSVNII